MGLSTDKSLSLQIKKEKEMSLNANHHLPLHLQLRNLLEKEIRAENYTEKIPSERELMDQFSVSRHTVREAISMLVREGLLEKKHGIGTFVSSRTVQEWLGNVKSYNNTVMEMGMQPSSKLLYHGIQTNPKHIAGIFDQDEFYLIKRLRLADEKLVALKSHYYPLPIGLQLARYDLNTAVLYDVLEHSLGIELYETEQIITSEMPTEEDANLLEIPQQSSVLIREQIIYDSGGNPVEYSKSIFRPDMYAFRLKTSRKRG